MPINIKDIRRKLQEGEFNAVELFKTAIDYEDKELLRTLLENGLRLQDYYSSISPYMFSRSSLFDKEVIFLLLEFRVPLELIMRHVNSFDVAFFLYDLLKDFIKQPESKFNRLSTHNILHKSQYDIKDYKKLIDYLSNCDYEELLIFLESICTESELQHILKPSGQIEEEVPTRESIIKQFKLYFLKELCLHDISGYQLEIIKDIILATGINLLSENVFFDELPFISLFSQIDDHGYRTYSDNDYLQLREFLYSQLDNPIDFVDENGWNLLHNFISRSSSYNKDMEEAISFLLNKGFDINTLTRSGDSALILAFKRPLRGSEYAHACGHYAPADLIDLILEK